MKKATLCSWLLAILFFSSGALYAGDCGAPFDRSGACGRNCMSANPDCGLRDCLSLCSGAGAVTSSENTTTVAAVDTHNAAVARAAVPGTAGAVTAAGVHRGELNHTGTAGKNRSRTNRNGGANRAGHRR